MQTADRLTGPDCKLDCSKEGIGWVGGWGLGVRRGCGSQNFVFYLDRCDAEAYSSSHCLARAHLPNQQTAMNHATGSKQDSELTEMNNTQPQSSPSTLIPHRGSISIESGKGNQHDVRSPYVCISQDRRQGLAGAKIHKYY